MERGRAGVTFPEKSQAWPVPGQHSESVLGPWPSDADLQCPHQQADLGWHCLTEWIRLVSGLKTSKQVPIDNGCHLGHPV